VPDGAQLRRAEGPRYAGERPSATAPRDRLRVVSFNIERALRVGQAIEVMEAEPSLRDADVILLQEMDEAGTRRVADAFGMSYVYYPATFSLKTPPDFGNAVLSRFPIVGDSKVLLPHLGVVGSLQRIATGATLQVGDTLVRVYSAHLGTMINATGSGQRDQLQAVLADADRYPVVIIGGDMNSHGVVRVAREHGYEWPTEKGPRTTRFGRWDHILLKGLKVAGPADAGDHPRCARGQRPSSDLGRRTTALAHGPDLTGGYEIRARLGPWPMSGLRGPARRVPSMNLISPRRAVLLALIPLVSPAGRALRHRSSWRAPRPFPFRPPHRRRRRPPSPARSRRGPTSTSNARSSTPS
jgi:endonuclease/exonuclease/phosphatase family metal-dependent hydrolase